MSDDAPLNEEDDGIIDGFTETWLISKTTLEEAALTFNSPNTCSGERSKAVNSLIDLVDQQNTRWYHKAKALLLLSRHGRPSDFDDLELEKYARYCVRICKEVINRENWPRNSVARLPWDELLMDSRQVSYNLYQLRLGMPIGDLLWTVADEDEEDWDSDTKEITASGVITKNPRSFATPDEYSDLDIDEDVGIDEQHVKNTKNQREIKGKGKANAEADANKILLLAAHVFIPGPRGPEPEVNDHKIQDEPSKLVWAYTNLISEDLEGMRAILEDIYAARIASSQQAGDVENDDAQPGESGQEYSVTKRVRDEDLEVETDRNVKKPRTGGPKHGHMGPLAMRPKTQHSECVIAKEDT